MPPADSTPNIKPTYQSATETLPSRILRRVHTNDGSLHQSSKQSQANLKSKHQQQQSQTDPSTATTILPTKFSFSQLWIRQKLFMNPSNTTALLPMQRTASAPPLAPDPSTGDNTGDISNDSRKAPQSAPGRLSKPFLPTSNAASTSSFTGSWATLWKPPRQSILILESASTIATADGTSTSVPAPLPSVSISPDFAPHTTRPHSQSLPSLTHTGSKGVRVSTFEDTSGICNSVDTRNCSSLNSDTMSRSCLKLMLAVVQKRIAEGNEQLEHYRQMIQQLMQDKQEAIESQRPLRQERDTIALGIEQLERSSRQAMSTTSLRRNAHFPKNRLSLFSNATGDLWTASSYSKPNSNHRCELHDINTAFTCQPETVTHTIVSPIMEVPSAPLLFRTLIASPTESAMASPSVSAPLDIVSVTSISSQCQPCQLEATLAEKQAQLKVLQSKMNQSQQKINSTGSQVKLINRTFIAPIQECLEEDCSEWARLTALAKTQVDAPVMSRPKEVKESDACVSMSARGI
ncbi:hypothetical protein BC939DRAFT_498846 [Gamsiella multidivaricata]|uniref:uncharacterized protein n=1 Tax=Gamsiella multidivaricata TaxID=101098 RepID=UPI002220DF3C|nr:uncharacterized protein BC939DRAFT_498846 [Gamsiella multidivaricata]KAG0367655.1 hypothetical protein BGZ54_003489 [Gamsiella multidivaricata]KAI7831396.1 hypothetical protein BC939DRAFT_498846 [Gamsiella multidivaricata]